VAGRLVCDRRMLKMVLEAQVVGESDSVLAEDIHLDPEPQARARRGCWRTLSSYFRFLLSRVVRVVKL
jgi:hypothetical protein